MEREVGCEEKSGEEREEWQAGEELENRGVMR